MGFEKGISGNPGGKQPGTISKRALVLKTLADDVVESGADRFKLALKGLTPYQYATVYLQLMEFSIPKKQRIEMTGADGDAIEVRQVFKIGEVEITL